MLTTATTSCRAMMQPNRATTGHDRRGAAGRFAMSRAGGGCCRSPSRLSTPAGGQIAIASLRVRADTLVEAGNNLQVRKRRARPPRDIESRRRILETLNEIHVFPAGRRPGRRLARARRHAAPTTRRRKRRRSRCRAPTCRATSFRAKFILNGFGCTGAQHVAGAGLEQRSGGNEVARAAGARPRCADRQRLLALGRLRHAADARPGWRKARATRPGSLPAGAYGGNTDFVDTGATGGNGNYGGPCPPHGDRPHRYVFTLYALAVDKVAAAGGIPKTGTAALYSFVMNKGVGPALLGKASFTATYGR